MEFRAQGHLRIQFWSISLGDMDFQSLKSTTISDSGISSTAISLNSPRLLLLSSPQQDPNEGLESLKIPNRPSIPGYIKDFIRRSL
jgi:hypothetical protein